MLLRKEFYTLPLTNIYLDEINNGTEGHKVAKIIIPLRNEIWVNFLSNSP